MKAGVNTPLVPQVTRCVLLICCVRPSSRARAHIYMYTNIRTSSATFLKSVINYTNNAFLLVYISS